MRLSVLIPVYNERFTIASVLAAVCAALPGVEKEVVIVDDCSTDGTRDFLKSAFTNARTRYRSATAESGGDLTLLPVSEGEPGVSFNLQFHERNRGKGGALQTAAKVATGDVVVVQDADLEYDPNDWAQMYDLIAKRKVADVVYGSRFPSAARIDRYFSITSWQIDCSRCFSIFYTIRHFPTSRSAIRCLRMMCCDRYLLRAMTSVLKWKSVHRSPKSGPYEFTK